MFVIQGGHDTSCPYRGLEAFGDEFGYVFDDGAVGDAGFSRFEHLRTEGAADSDDFRAGGFRFLVAFDVDGFRAVFLFLPELCPARAAAEGTFAMTRHFDLIHAQAVQDTARLIHDAVVPPQIAGVVESDVAGFAGAGAHRQSARVNQFVDEFGVMHDLVAAAKLMIFLAEVVEAVRAGDDDPLGLDLV